jgi:hypothetical protein
MARVAHVAVPVIVELVSGIVGTAGVEASSETVTLEEVHPASTPAPRPTATATATATVTIRSAALTRPDDRGGILTSGGRC